MSIVYFVSLSMLLWSPYYLSLLCFLSTYLCISASFVLFSLLKLLLSIQIGSHPNIYVLDTPAILSPKVPNVDILSKLILTGMFNWLSFSFDLFFFHSLNECYWNLGIKFVICLKQKTKLVSNQQWTNCFYFLRWQFKYLASII